MVRKSSVGVEFLTINVLLHTKSEQRVIGNRFCKPINFKNSLKISFSIKYTFYKWCRACLECNKIFLIRKADL